MHLSIKPNLINLTNQFFSVKRLQVVDLVTRHGTFERLNLKIPTDTFLYNFNEFRKFTKANHTSVNFNYFGLPTLLSEILTEHGFCYTFNLATYEELYNSELVAADFYHDYFSTIYDTPPADGKFPRLISGVTSLVVFVRAPATYYDKIFNGLRDGHLIYIHDAYELPTKFFQSL